MTTPLTPEQVNNIKLWYDALRSGKYQPISPPNASLRNDDSSCHCAIGVMYDAVSRALSCWFFDFSTIEDSIGISVGVPFHISYNFEHLGWSFADAANYLHDYLLENHAIDLDDWPESASTAHVESAPKAHVQ